MTDANQTSTSNAAANQATAKLPIASTAASASSNTTTTTTTKPRLSLLSTSKQSGIRINSDEQLDQQQQNITILSTGTHDEFIRVNSNNNSNNNNNSNSNNNLVGESVEGGQIELDKENANESSSAVATNSAARNTQLDESNRMNVSKEDLIRLLSMLKSELQSKEIALAAIKCEQLKRLINPVEISRSSLANTYIELQDRIKICDQNNNKDQQSASNNNNIETTNQRNVSSMDISENRTKENYGSPTTAATNGELNDEESLNILNTLLEMLDRHPLLALPRDSIYCLDYNCNELSTKNYLNLKIQHLDNLINQHRRYRYYMNERLKKSEQRYLDLTHQLELERLLKSEIEKSAYKATGRAILLKHIDDLKEALEKEKNDKQVIVMTLLNELLDERERIKKLINKNSDSMKSSIDEDAEQANRDKEKISKLEAEITELSDQLRKQSIGSNEKNELQMKNSLLISENLALKAKLEQQEAKLAALMKSTSNNPTLSSKPKEVLQSSSPSSPNRNGGAKQVIPGNKSTQGNSSSPTAPAVTSRGSISAAKSSPPARVSSTNVSSTSVAANNSSQPQRGASVESIQSQAQTAAASSKLVGNQKSTGFPPIVSRLTSNNSNESQQQTIRIQPLFKTSVMSSGGGSNQQARNLKSSMSTGGIGSGNGAGSSTSSTGTAPTISPRVATNANNQTVTKPRVPAKPAQLLDQQRNSVN